MEDIKPIDKFTLDKYVKEEDDLLEYVKLVAMEFCPDVYEGTYILETQALDIFKNRYNRKFIENKFSYADYKKEDSIQKALQGIGIETEVATEQQAAEEETKYVFMGTTVTQEFKKRYNAKVLNVHYTFEKYIQYEDIQNTLEALDIDREKFWYLLLFVSDYIYGSCLEGIKVKETSRVLVEKFMQQIEKNINNKNSKASFIKPMTLTLKLEGEHHSMKIDDPISLDYIHLMYKVVNEYFSVDFPTILDTQEIDRKGKDTEPNTVLVAMFYHLLKSFFKLLPKTNTSKSAKAYSTVSLNKTLLISRLVYLTRLSTDKRYTGVDEKKDKQCPNFIKDQIKSYKDYKILRANKFYK